MTDSSSARIDERKANPILGFLKRLLNEKPLGACGAAITLLLLLSGVFAGLIAPYGLNESTGVILAAPSARFWLGTDNIGRDLLSRMIFGARISMIVGLAAASISACVTLFLGLLSGFIGGRFDLLVQRFVDAVMCLPVLVLLIAIIASVGRSMWILIIVLGTVTGIRGSRIIRGAVIGIKQSLYVMSAVSIGCPITRILTRHILPNVMAPLIVNFSLQVPAIIMLEASLSFLGYGIPPPAPSWGGMLGRTGRVFMFRAPWMVIWPGLALAIVVYGINMFGDALRDLLDPRLRGGAGSYRGMAKNKRK